LASPSCYDPFPAPDAVPVKYVLRFLRRISISHLPLNNRRSSLSCWGPHRGSHDPLGHHPALSFPSVTPILCSRTRPDSNTGRARSWLRHRLPSSSSSAPRSLSSLPCWSQTDQAMASTKISVSKKTAMRLAPRQQQSSREERRIRCCERLKTSSRRSPGQCRQRCPFEFRYWEVL